MPISSVRGSRTILRTYETISNETRHRPDHATNHVTPRGYTPIIFCEPVATLLSQFPLWKRYAKSEDLADKLLPNACCILRVVDSGSPKILFTQPSAGRFSEIGMTEGLTLP